jgi:hypothetical protein
VQLAALQGFQDFNRRATGEAVEQDRRVPQADRQARRAVVMRWTTAFAARAAPDSAELLDDILGADLGV